jgi:hypothetical protein
VKSVQGIPIAGNEKGIRYAMAYMAKGTHLFYRAIVWQSYLQSASEISTYKQYVLYIRKVTQPRYLVYHISTVQLLPYIYLPTYLTTIGWWIEIRNRLLINQQFTSSCLSLRPSASLLIAPSAPFAPSSPVSLTARRLSSTVSNLINLDRLKCQMGIVKTDWCSFVVLSNFKLTVHKKVTLKNDPPFRKWPRMASNTRKTGQEINNAILTE